LLRISDGKRSEWFENRGKGRFDSFVMLMLTPVIEIWIFDFQLFGIDWFIFSKKMG
jgi:hypothetical protein